MRIYGTDLKQKAVYLKTVVKEIRKHVRNETTSAFAIIQWFWSKEANKERSQYLLSGGKISILVLPMPMLGASVSYNMAS